MNDLFSEMDMELDNPPEKPQQLTPLHSYCSPMADELAKHLISEECQRIRVLQAIAKVSHLSCIHPKLKNCIGYIKLVNPIKKKEFAKIYDRLISAQYVKKEIYRARLVNAHVTYKSFPVEIKHQKVVHYIMSILKLLTGMTTIETTVPKPEELKSLDSRVTWRKLKTTNIRIAAGDNSRHFLRLLDRIFHYYKPRNNAGDIVPSNQTDLAASKRQSSIQLEKLFGDLDLQMAYSAGDLLDNPDYDDGDDDDDGVSGHSKSRIKKKKKKKRVITPPEFEDEVVPNFALLLHATVMQVNPSEGRKSVQDIQAESMAVCNYINTKNSLSKMWFGSTMHSINVVGEFRIPDLVGVDIEKFQTDLISNVIRAGNIKKAGRNEMSVEQKKDMNKFPSLRIKIENLYGMPNFKTTLQLFGSGIVSITGPKTPKHLYDFYPGILLILYATTRDKLTFLTQLERSLIDLQIHNKICEQFDARDIESKLDEEYRKEKIFGNSPTNGSAKKKKKKKAAGDEKQAEKITFRKSDLAKPKEKFVSRYNSKYATNFHRLQSSEFNTSEWMSDVLSVFNYHTFSSEGGFREWLEFVKPL